MFFLLQQFYKGCGDSQCSQTYHDLTLDMLSMWRSGVDKNAKICNYYMSTHECLSDKTKNIMSESAAYLHNVTEASHNIKSKVCQHARNNTEAMLECMINICKHYQDMLATHCNNKAGCESHDSAIKGRWECTPKAENKTRDKNNCAS